MPHALASLPWVLLLAAVAMSACGPKPRYTAEQLAASPEGQLRYPGATYTAPVTSNGSRALDNTNVVHLGLGTNDAPDAVGLWYDGQLTSAGWRRRPSGVSRFDWLKDDRELVVVCETPVNPTSSFAQFSTSCNVGLGVGPPATTTPESPSVSPP